MVLMGKIIKEKPISVEQSLELVNIYNDETSAAAVYGGTVFEIILNYLNIICYSFETYRSWSHFVN